MWSLWRGSAVLGWTLSVLPGQDRHGRSQESSLEAEQGIHHGNAVLESKCVFRLPNKSIQRCGKALATLTVCI